MHCSACQCMFHFFFFFVVVVMCYEASRSLLNLWTMNIQNDGLLIKRKNGVFFSEKKGACTAGAVLVPWPNHSSCDTAPFGGGKPKKWEPLKPLFVHFILAKAINVYIYVQVLIYRLCWSKKKKPHPWGSLTCYYPAALPRNPLLIIPF